MLTPLQLECYEHIAKKAYSEGCQSIMEGNLCSAEISVLSYVEGIIAEEDAKSGLVSAFVDELITLNNKLARQLRDLGDE